MLQKFANQSERLQELYPPISTSILSRPPYGLGYQSVNSQTPYYLNDEICEDEISRISKLLEEHGFHPENTRISKTNEKDYNVLIAAVDLRSAATLSLPNNGGTMNIFYGDHRTELEKVCLELEQAARFAANDHQKKFLHGVRRKFQDG